MRQVLKIIGVISALLIILLTTTQPADLPSIVLIVPFVGVMLILSLTIACVIAWHGDRKITYRTIRIGCIGALLPILLLVLQSVGQLTWRDGLTLIALFVITYFYMSKINAPVSS